MKENRTYSPYSSSSEIMKLLCNYIQIVFWMKQIISESVLLKQKWLRISSYRSYSYKCINLKRSTSIDKEIVVGGFNMKIESNAQSAHMPMPTAQTMNNEMIGRDKESVVDKNIDLLEYNKLSGINLLLQKTVIEAIEKANKKLSGVMAEFEFQSMTRQNKLW